jgi:hypothetical protein
VDTSWKNLIRETGRKATTPKKMKKEDNIRMGNREIGRSDVNKIG